MVESTKLEAWNRLCLSHDLLGLPLRVIDGRIDLRNITIPESSKLQRIQVSGLDVTKLKSVVEIRDAKWRGLDFTGSKLPSIRLFNSEVQNCLFEECKLQDLRIWSSTIEDSSFIGADLRNAGLGGIDQGKRNRFIDVDFSEADLRKTAYKSVSFERCLFRNTKLENVDFQGSTFTDCRFDGELRGVLFYRLAFNGEDFPPNEMSNVDFSRAKLRYVDFRGLDMDKVKFPEDADHVIIKNFALALDKAMERLDRSSDIAAKKLLFYLGNYRKWATPRQTQGVLNILDLIEVAGESAPARLIAALSG